MTDIQNKILAYLIDNADMDGEITISNVVLAEQCNVSIPTIQKFQKDGVNEGMFQYEKGKYKIGENAKVDYTYTIANILKEKSLNYTPNEKKIFGYIAKVCYDLLEVAESAYISYQNIIDNCKVSTPTISKTIKKLVADGLIEYEQGDYREKQANKFRLLCDNNITPKNNNIDNTSINSNNNININIDTSAIQLLLEEQTKAIKELREENKELKEVIGQLKSSLCNHIDKYNRVIDGVSEKLLQRIDDLEHDIDNLYYINNISVPERTKYNIQDIRKYIDDIFNS